MSKPISMHIPTGPKPMRLNVQLTGALAAQIQALADEYQTTPATLLRELAVDGLRARRKLREVG